MMVAKFFRPVYENSNEGNTVRKSAALLAIMLAGCGGGGSDAQTGPASNPTPISGPRISGDVVIKALNKIITPNGDEERGTGKREGDTTIAAVGQFVESGRLLRPTYGIGSSSYCGPDRSGSNCGTDVLPHISFHTRFDQTATDTWALYPDAWIRSDQATIELKRATPLLIKRSDQLHTSQSLSDWGNDRGSSAALVLATNDNDEEFRLCWDTFTPNLKRRQCGTFTRADGTFRGVYVMDTTTAEARIWESGPTRP